MGLEELLKEHSWHKELNQDFKKSYFKTLESKVLSDIHDGVDVYPSLNNIFRALDTTPLENVKVVVLGQDPYHKKGQADGLSFSVPEGVKTPPSLKNILTELNADYGSQINKKRKKTDLEDWAKQGVLLLNHSLTVCEGRAGSHSKYGWAEFTDSILKIINNAHENCVFILWGSFANQKKMYIDQEKHLVISSVHPSPLSAYRGFFGSCPFSRANQYLISKNRIPINWI